MAKRPGIPQGCSGVYQENNLLNSSYLINFGVLWYLNEFTVSYVLIAYSESIVLLSSETTISNSFMAAHATIRKSLNILSLGM